MIFCEIKISWNMLKIMLIPGFLIQRVTLFCMYTHQFYCCHVRDIYWKIPFADDRAPFFILDPFGLFAGKTNLSKGRRVYLSMVISSSVLSLTHSLTYRVKGFPNYLSLFRIPIHAPTHLTGANQPGDQNQYCVELRTARCLLVPDRKSVCSCLLEVRNCHFLCARARSMFESESNTRKYSPTI